MRTVPLLLLLCIAAGAESDLAARIGDKDVSVRVQAVRTIEEIGHPDAEPLLLKALEDDDWEVVHRAAEALGARGSKKSIDPLADLAMDGPTRQIRHAAAAALRRLDAEAGAKVLERKLKGKDLERAAEALRVLGTTTAIKPLEKMLRHKDAERRLIGVSTLGALGDKERIPDFADFLSDEDVRVRAAAVAALVRTADLDAIRPLRDGLKSASMPRVMERRHIAGIRELLRAAKDEKARDFAATLCLRTFGMGESGEANARFVRLVASLGRKDEPVGPVEEYKQTLLGGGLSSTSVDVRSASVAALARLGATEAYDKVASIAASDSSWRVRLHALRTADALRGAEAKDLFVDRLGDDASPNVREEAAVLLGLHRIGVEPLIRALEDESWEVAVSAAVSLGKTRHERAVEPLAQLAKHKDWRRRGAAAVGLGWVQQKAAVDALVDLVRDKDTTVVATAVEFLRHTSGKPLEAKHSLWKEWWEERREKFTFRDPEEAEKEARKYGYAVTPDPRDVYKDLDIVVLLTRRGGDHIEDLLAEYGIAHRGVRSASVYKCGLHPYAIFIANCPGDLVSSDVPVLQWFVRTGGYLFSSCWAVTNTVKLCFPDVVQKVDLKGQVLDVVEAQPRPSDSPLLHKVFDDVTRPLYMLEGAHLIDVVDPERFEVLVDSPECASKYGEGDLAGWFSIGHGIVFDSVNHFDLQGMERFRLKTEDERMAFAIDHLGYDYAEARRLKEQGIFRKQPTAAKGTRDQTIFRLITNFVRQKRAADQR